jgi:hypothetical protein
VRLQGNGGWKVYPNPTSGNLTVSWTAQATRLSLMDTNGRPIRSYLLNPDTGNQAVTMDDLPAGLYWLRLECEEGVMTERVVKR